MEIERGEFAVFVGPSGCGKSTLLRMIAGLEETTAGRIEIEGARRHPGGAGQARRRDGLPVLRALSAPDGLREHGLQPPPRPAAAPEVEAKVGEAARILRLEDHLQKKPSQLSGGQRQRVAIGRAIVRQPKVFLFDEPLSNLDAELRVQMRLELARLHKQIGATMIYVTHDQVEAMTLADKIFVLQAGVVRQSGRPLELYDDPDNRFVAGFIGSPAMNFLAGKVVGATEAGVDDRARRRRRPRRSTARLRGARPATGTRVTLGMRPEHLEIAPDGAEGPAAHRRDGGGPRRRLLPACAHARPASRSCSSAAAAARTSRAGGSPPRCRADRALVFDDSGARAAMTGNQTLKTEEDTALKHFLKAAAAATALLIGVGRSRRGRGGGHLVGLPRRRRRRADEGADRRLQRGAPRHPRSTPRPSTGACRSTPRSAPRPRSARART